MPLTLFLTACQSACCPDGQELFERIHQANIMALVELLKRLNTSRDDTARLLRLGCLNQLTALSQHIGHRAELIPRPEALNPDLNPSVELDMPWDNPPK